MRDTTRDVHAQLKALRLNGMAVAWADLVEQGGDSTLDASRWLVEHLLQAEDADRAMRSIAHQMKSARFPMHRDLAGFNFEVSQVDKALIQKLGMPVRDVMRAKEAIYKELGLDAESVTDAQRLEAVAAHPVLLNRPIVVCGQKALLCRPPEQALQFFASNNV